MIHCFDKDVFTDFVRFLGPYDTRAKERMGDKL